MAKKTLEDKVVTVLIGPLVKPETKELLRRVAKARGISMGALIDEAVLLVERQDGKDSLEAVQGQVDAFSRAIEEAAVLAGICNDEIELGGPELLMLCQDLGVAAKRGIELAAQPEAVTIEDYPLAMWGLGEIRRLETEYGVTGVRALEMVFDFYNSMGKTCPECSRRLAGLPQAEEAGATSSEAPSTLPGDVSCLCAHCGQPFMGARFSSLCHGCGTEGHVGDVRDCPACGGGQAL